MKFLYQLTNIHYFITLILSCLCLSPNSHQVLWLLSSYQTRSLSSLLIMWKVSPSCKCTKGWGLFLINPKKWVSSWLLFNVFFFILRRADANMLSFRVPTNFYISNLNIFPDLTRQCRNPGYVNLRLCMSIFMLEFEILQHN